MPPAGATTRGTGAATLRYAVDDTPPHPLAAGLALQTVALIISGVVLVPIIALSAADAPADAVTWAVFAALAVSGISTIVQARPIGRVGSGYLLFMGTSGAFIAVCTLAARAGGLPLVASLVVVSAVAEFVFAARLSWLRRVVTPTVGGTVIMLIAVSVFSICFDLIRTIPPGLDAASPVGPLIALTTFATILGASLVGDGPVRLWAPLGGVVIGSALAWACGAMDFSRVAAAPWVGLPDVSWPGLAMPDGAFLGLLPGFLIVTLIGSIETYGDAIAMQRVSHRERRPVDFAAVQGALNADGFGNLLSGLAGTLPNTTYATSISVAELTGVAARRVGVWGGLFLLVAAFLPKVSALLQGVPKPVVGAYALILIVLLFAQGLRLVSEGGLSYENGLVVCLAFWLGMGFQNRLVFPEQLPGWAHTLLDNGMTAGGLVAVLLTLLLSLKDRTRSRVTLEPNPSSVPALHELLARLGTTMGWDRAAIDHLQLAGEEALLFLVEQEPERSTPRTLQVAARAVNGRVELELASGPAGQNLESRLAELDDEPGVPEDAGLRILRHLAADVQHQQFQDRNYLTIVVDSRPLG